MRKSGWVSWVLAVALVLCGLAAAGLALHWYYLAVREAFGVARDASLFGDAFGAFSALASALATIGVVGALLLQQKQLTLQRKELRLQREELAMQREELRKAADAQAAQVDVMQESALAARAQVAAAESVALHATLDRFEVFYYDAYPIVYGCVGALNEALEQKALSFEITPHGLSLRGVRPLPRGPMPRMPIVEHGFPGKVELVKASDALGAAHRALMGELEPESNAEAMRIKAAGIDCKKLAKACEDAMFALRDLRESIEAERASASSLRRVEREPPESGERPVTTPEDQAS